MSLGDFIFTVLADCCGVSLTGVPVETGASPPEGHPRENLLVLYLKNGSTVLLCANSEDEAL